MPATTVSQHTGVGTATAVSQKGGTGYTPVSQKTGTSATPISGHSGVTGYTEVSEH